MLRLLKKFHSLSSLGFVPLGLIAALTFAARPALSQPANDDFANAQAITGGSGFTTGDNIGATTEGGEPATIGGAPSGASVWYTWTAPTDGSYTFDTAGSSFDTMLGVYTGTSVGALTSIAENDDANLNAGILTSKVTFNAVSGTTYQIAVAGFLGFSQGSVILNWGAGGATSLAAGDFRFTSGFYLFSENESFAPREAHMNATPGGRITVTRAAGSSGRVLADYSITNGLYTNVIIGYTFGTNILLMDTNGGFTNMFFTNTVEATYLQDNQYGNYTYLDPWVVVTNVGFTNENGFITGGSTNFIVGTNVPDIFCFNGSFFDTNTPPLAITNYFCTNWLVFSIVPAAANGIDYFPTSGTLVFDDYQMSADVFVPIFPHPARNLTLNHPLAPVPNRVLIATIDTVALDPLESTLIPPPTAASLFRTTLINVLDEKTYRPTSRGVVQPLLGAPREGIRDVGTIGTNIFNFERATLRCSENVGGPGIAHVAVLRSSRDYSQGVTVNYRMMFREQDQTVDGNNLFQGILDEMPLQAGSDYATPPNPATYSTNVDFTTVTGTLTWGAFDGQPKFIDIPINNDNLVEFNEDILLQLPYDQSSRVGYVGSGILTILFDDIDNGEQPAGAVDRMHNQDANASSVPPYNLHPGANGTVYAVAVQPDGKTIVGGAFSGFNTVPRNGLARMNANGQLDTGFNPGDGADQFVSSLVLDSSGRIIAGGAFNSINRTPRHGIARLNPNGSVDSTFTPGVGADGTVWAVALDPNGNILIAGEFTSYNSTGRNFIARILPTGLIDPSFDPGVGPDGPIHSIAVQADGTIYIGGEFSNVDGVPRSRIARLSPDGSLDASFDPGFGADDTVYTLALQPDGKLLVGGAFHQMQAVVRNGIVRLTSTGYIDLEFNPGDAANDTVYAITVQPDGAILVGGIFTSFNQTRRVGVTRIYANGTVDTSFMDTGYNQFAGIINHYSNVDLEPNNYIFALGLEAGGNVIIGGGFERVGGGFTRDDIRNRSNVARLIGGGTPGPGNIELVYDNYTADQTGEQLFISLFRSNGHLGPAAATIAPATLPPGPGAAVAGVDFALNPIYSTPTYLTSYPLPTWQLQDGLFGQNQGFSETVDPTAFQTSTANDVFIDILDSTNAGNKQLNLVLSNPTANDLFALGGENIPLGVALGRSSAALTIVDPHTPAGVLGFSSPTYIVSEATNAVVTITRTNGSTGLVTVQCQTLNGTAINGINYRTNYARLTFNPGVTNLNFTVTNINESVIQGDHTINLRLYSPSGGATLGQSNAVITVVDDDFTGGYAQFNSPTYFTNENSVFALVTVNRNGGSLGTLAVQFATTNGTAVSGVNYTGITNTLTWANGNVTPKIIPIRIFDDGIVNSNNLTVGLKLFAATVNGVTNIHGLGNPTNALLTITNSDFRGQLAFSTDTYDINENGGPATITVIRTGGSAESITANFATLPGSSTPGTDFFPTNGTLSFGPGVVSRSFTVPIVDNQFQDFPRFIALVLSNAVPAGTLGSPSTAVLNIVDDESINEPPGDEDTSENPALGFNAPVNTLALQPDGRLLVGGDFTNANGLTRNRFARMSADGFLDTKFSSVSADAGANDSVLSILCQTDQRVVLGGRFTAINSVNRNYIARLSYDGSIDTTFNPGSGPDGVVNAVAETFVGVNRKLLIGGSFVTFNAAPRSYIARLNDNGSIDASFNPGLGADAQVFAVAVQKDGKVILGGDFTTMNANGRNHIARLNVDGSLDLSFDPGTGANDSVRAIAIQSDGRIVLGGLFTSVNGAALNHIARLNANGSVDNTFTPGIGANDVVSAIAIAPDTRIVLGGQFTLCNGVTRHRVTRLNNDGTVDAMINFGAGANSFVSALVIQPDHRIILGGGFTTYDGKSHPRIVRIYGGAIGGSGAFEFTSDNYLIDENATNAIVTVRRRGGTSGAPTGNVSVTFNTSNGSAVAGVNYLAVTTNLTFAQGEVFRDVLIPVLQDFAINTNLTVNLALSNPQPAGGPALGNQANSQLTILNDDAGISFSAANYARNEDASDGVATIQVIRSGSDRGPASVVFMTLTNGTAIAGTNYIPVSNVVTFAQGQSSNIVQVPVLHDFAAQGSRTVALLLTNAVGAFVFNPSTATLVIIDVEHLPGDLAFGQTNYVVGEGDGFLPVTIVRTNGRTGIVSVNFRTVPGTATPGLKYVSTNGILTFADGETNKTFTVPIINNAIADGNLSFSLMLSNATGGASIVGQTNVLATIIDNDTGLSFSSPAYVATENSGTVSLTVLRQGGTNGVATVQYATTNLTAIAGSNYVATSGSLVFTNGETIKSFSVQLLHDPRVTGDVSFGVNLFNPSVGAQLLNPSSAVVVVLDNESGFSFTNSNFATIKSGTNVLITVLRTNANNGLATVNYSTANGSAIAGVDYTATSGLLTFSNGIAFQTFSVPIINNQIVSGSNLTFSVYLTNATPTNVAFLVPPSVATVTITNDLAGLRFSSSGYSVNENGVSAVITVLRTGYTSNTVSVSYTTANGSGTAGVNYFAVSGSFTFTNGETTKTFSVPVIDNGVADGDKTVLLSLLNVVGKAVLVNPSAAILTIGDIDGSLVLPAGSSIVSESGPVNGNIDTNETVTVLLALRNASGTNTSSLVATLLGSTNILNPSGPQNYGALPVHGPSTFRPFTFTANGTNGQSVAVVLQLRDGSTVLSNAVFNFTLGNLPTAYSNTAAIVINDFTNATPYPSIINVSGVAGQVTKATVTLTNISHTYPSDIDVLLVSPAGQKSYLMAKAGAGNALNHVTLTFDDAASSSLPQFGTIVSGTNRPSAYPVAPPPFPLPAPPPAYNTNLSVFNNSNPNGAWALYVYDDSQVNSGIIANGWILRLNTGSPNAADVGVSMVASQTNDIVAASNVTYTITVANYGPSTATNVVVTDTLPAGAAYVSSSASQGSASTNGGGLLTWTVGSLPTNAVATLSLVVQPSIPGAITNTAVATTTSTDGNPDDNTASVVANVIAPLSDLVMGMAGSANPVLLGNNLTYSLTVTNLGPATASGLSVTNTLPPGVTFVSASPPGYTVSGRTVAFPNLGNLGSGGIASASITVTPTVPGEITNVAICASLVTDPLKANNSASIKTVVQGVQMSVGRAGNNLVISWPANLGAYNVESTPNLLPPIVWTVVTNPPPVNVGGQMTLTVPFGAGNKFFRLHGQ